MAMAAHEMEHELHEILRRLARLERRDGIDLTHLETLMIDVATLIKALNDNTNAVSSRIDALLAAINASKLPDGSVVLSPDQVALVSTVNDHLKQLGADPANPVPPAFPADSTHATAAPAAAVQGPTG